jgi:RND family efflux transporter MFP subunit
MPKRILVWLLAIGGLLVTAGLLTWSYMAHHAEIAAEASGDAAIKNPAKVGNEGGEPVVTLDDDVQERMDIKSETVAPMTRRQQVVAYGSLEEDPSGSFVLRAPLAGVIQGAQGKAWPAPGDNVADGARLGQIEPRLAPTDRITLNDRMAAAQAEVETDRVAVSAAQTALNRTRELNADDKNMSDRAVQEAEARLATEQARLSGAQQSVRLLTAALASSRDAAVTLDVTRGGMVAEVMAHPGESVESGQPILRVARFDKLLARVDVPAGETIAPGLNTASIVPLGNDAKPLTGERVGFAASVDPKTQGQPFVFRVTDTSGVLRPGLSVTAYLETPGAARTGSVVPRSAVLWQTGKSWVYVQTEKEKFARREVVLEDPASGGWFTRSLKPGDKVVTRGAQMLLSEEFKSQIKVEDDQN